MTERDYGQIMHCRACGWRGPFYLTKPASIYPGRVSCPDCGSERTEVDDRNGEQGRSCETCGREAPPHSGDTCPYCDTTYT